MNRKNKKEILNQTKNLLIATTCATVITATSLTGCISNQNEYYSQSQGTLTRTGKIKYKDLIKVKLVYIMQSTSNLEEYYLVQEHKFKDDFNNQCKY